MTEDEKSIIEMATKNALIFGTGILWDVKTELEDHGFLFTQEHEDYTLDFIRIWSTEL